MLSDIGIYSYASTALCMLLLAVFLVFQPVRNRQKLPLFLIFISSAIWASGITVDSYKQITSFVLLLECLRYICWYLLLLSVLPTNHSFRRNLIPLIGSLAVLLVIVAYPSTPIEKTNGQISLPPLGTAKSLSLIAINIIALGVIEQIIRVPC